MVLWVWIVLALIPFSSWLIIEWIWKPWNLILACQKQGMSGFPFIPFVGQLPQISKTLKRIETGSGHDWEAVTTAQKCVEKHGKVFYFTSGKTVRICIADPDLLKIVLSINADNYAKPSFIHVLDILGDGLFASSGQVWARQRQLLGLSFANKEIKVLGLTPDCHRTTYYFIQTYHGTCISNFSVIEDTEFDCLFQFFGMGNLPRVNKSCPNRNAASNRSDETALQF